MVDQVKKITITEQIDKDKGLKSKRNQLMVTSLILLALSFSGAKVEEANTFILKLKFENQEGISVLLVLTIMFLMLRYYNYAGQYHQKLYKLWAKRLLKDNFFLEVHPYDSSCSGLIPKLEPKGFDIEYLNYEKLSWDYQFKCSFLFVRKITYSWCDMHQDFEEEIGVGRENYFKVLRLEAKYQLESFIVHRENLDIIAPYLIGLMAITSYFYNDQFQAFLKILSGS